ncbi:hypothetical protein QE417_004178 [Mucilaginibacter terrae]|uniref:Uncharacterized protein n=1 Tax=Mucilaginibacter terrae TaxID=1955052 RepID=A0ABU3GZB2_9SPHI|nr:hypothetical protein [Mucilaginibacter terrae]
MYAGKYALGLYPKSGVLLLRLAKSNRGDGSVMMVSSGIQLTTKSMIKPKQVLLGKYLDMKFIKLNSRMGLT